MNQTTVSKKVNKNHDDDVEKPKWDFDIGVIYEFTISPNDGAQIGSLELDQRYVKLRKQIRGILRGIGSMYSIVPEVTVHQYGDKHVNTIPRLHFHGLMVFRSNKEKWNWLLYGQIQIARMGRFQFNSFRPDYWPGYCSKQRLFMEEVVEHYLLSNSLELDKALGVYNKNMFPEGY